ncbi:MAG: GOLPH3/VPS74 family protein [Cellulomonadaceae bacterium]
MSARDLLLVEDLMLLLLDDDGASVQAAGTLYYTLGGALLTELALLGRVRADDSPSLNGPRVKPSGEGRLPDPLLQRAFDTVSATTQRVQPLLVTLGADLSQVLLGRLRERGLIRREDRRPLKIFRSTRWPANDGQHEAALRERILRVLDERDEPDARTAALIGLLYASGAMPSLRPSLPWTSQTMRRAAELQRGEWGAGAVAEAVNRTASAIAAASAVVIATTVARGR